MAEQNNLIDDVRLAKESVNSQDATFAELGDRLRAVEKAYRAREGEFAAVPTTRSDAVQHMIDAAAKEPGHEFLKDLRPAS